MKKKTLTKLEKKKLAELSPRSRATFKFRASMPTARVQATAALQVLTRYLNDDRIARNKAVDAVLAGDKSLNRVKIKELKGLMQSKINVVCVWRDTRREKPSAGSLDYEFSCGETQLLACQMTGARSTCSNTGIAIVKRPVELRRHIRGAKRFKFTAKFLAIPLEHVLFCSKNGKRAPDS